MRRFGIRKRTVLGVALVELVILSAAALAGIGWFQKHAYEEAHHSGEAIAEAVASSVNRAVSNYEEIQLDPVLAHFIEQRGVAYIRVLDQDANLIFYRKFAPETPHGSSLLYSQIQAIESPVTLTYGQTGRVVLGIVPPDFLQMLRKFGITGAGLVIAGVLVAAVLSFVSGSALLRQIKKLRSGIQHISEIGPGIQVNVTGHDELDELIESFNEMSSSLVHSQKTLKDSLETQERLSNQLDRHQKLLSATISSALDAVITIDRHGHVQEFNESAERIFGFSRYEVIDHELADIIIPPALRSAHKQGMKHFRETGEAPVLGQRLELTALHKDGHEFDCELAIRSVEVGNETLFTAFMRDISDRKQAEQELLLAAHAFDANEAIFVSDRDGTILRVNKAFCRITGYEEADVLGHNPKMLSSGEHPREFYKALWKELLSEGRWSGEIINQRKNGELLPEFLSISSVKDGGGEITHFVAHFIDLSEQKRTERSLQQARNEAERASQAKTSFLAAMSHEIRTPLNAIINMNQLLLESELNDEQKKYVATADEAGQTLMALVNNVLDFSRIEAGQLSINNDWFNATVTLSSIIHLFEHSASQKHLKLTYDHQVDEHIQHWSDPLRFRQIALNLIGNAIKFTEKGEVKVTLSVLKPTGLILSVADTGIGIHADVQEKLFDEFFQVEAGHSRTYQGTGLGLAITRQLTELMGGSIRVESEPGTGTTFFVTLPLKERASETPILFPTKHQNDNSAHRKPSVLVVEDSVTNRAVVSEVLKNEVTEIAIAEDGEEAVLKAGLEKFDLILMDMAMPVMDGLAATRKIRTTEGVNQQTPIIAMTANAFEDDRNACFDAGMDDFISKPIEIARLREMVRHWSQISYGLHESQSEQKGNPEARLMHDANLGDWEEEKILDESVISKLAADAGQEAMPVLVSTILSETKKRLEKIQQSYLNEDYAQLMLEAHTLKSSIGTFGAKRLQLLARSLEFASKEENDELLELCMSELKENTRQALHAIQEHLKSKLVT